MAIDRLSSGRPFRYFRRLVRYSYAMSHADDKAARFAFFSLSSRAWELAIGAALALRVASLQTRCNPLRRALVSGRPRCHRHIRRIVQTGYAVSRGGRFAADDRCGCDYLGRLAGAAFLGGSIPVGPGLSRHWAPVLLLVSLALASARHREGSQPCTPDLGRDVAIAVGALGLAWLTYIWIEQPVRSGRVWSDWSKARAVGAGSGFVSSASSCSSRLESARQPTCKNRPLSPCG